MSYPALPVCIRSMRYKFPPLIDFYFPEVIGMTDGRAQQNMNNQIIHLMNRLISQFNQEDYTTYITGSFEIKANQRDVLSLILWALGDFGGAHPMTYVDTLNFDVTTGVNQSLQSQFKPGSDYVKRLSDIVAVQIKERNIPLLDEFTGIRPNQNYYISDNVLILYFDLYDIAPYAAGFPYFPIPLYQIEDIIDENSLLQKVTYII